ncbi:pyrroline-5-carboxylate reductase [Fundicoccus culcitae]|uniref:Pyrroline-5-carboxylate reductase n=1 Tax=Fundicoccus culcitae TaxID=2969821 RepID=A0ABY5P7T6_9LACT|nr:pyrroline-5-carboxylate reductase [Fundicoccus culcitae]UUX34793.1 pyrroline-5-carboxylate reductase [Fundicoccus culcitae]
MRGNIGFIGAGNMGQAIMGGILASKLVTAKEIVVFDRYQTTLDAVKTTYDITAVNSEIEVVEQAEIIILAVKPNTLADVLVTVKDAVTPDKIIVSIAGGKSLTFLSKYLPENTKIIRVMPNTPAMVGEGMSALCVNDWITRADEAEVLSIFESFGKAKIMDEGLIDAVTGVSGASPAFVYMFIEALADGAVALGMSRADAYTFAAQTVLGSAKMVLETGKHPGELKDMVTSPAGSTIEGVKILEDNKFRSAVMNAVIAVGEKNANM